MLAKANLFVKILERHQRTGEKQRQIPDVAKYIYDVISSQRLSVSSLTPTVIAFASHVFIIRYHFFISSFAPIRRANITN